MDSDILKKLEEVNDEFATVHVNLCEAIEHLNEVWDEIDEDFKQKVASCMSDFWFPGDDELDTIDVEDAVENLLYATENLLEEMKHNIEPE